MEHARSLIRLNGIQETLGSALVTKFTTESAKRAGEQYLPDQSKLNCTPVVPSVPSHTGTNGVL